MASRKETNASRQALQEELRRACLDGSLPIGEPLSSVRVLAGRYNVSHRIVSEAIQSLMNEGLLYSLPRQGIFVGQPHQAREGIYLLVTQHPVLQNDQLSRLQDGFEGQISQLGGTCLTIEMEALSSMLNSRSTSASEPFLPAGIFYQGHPQSARVLEKLPSSCARVFLAEQKDAAEETPPSDDHDTIYFDHESGGYQVTHYLLQQGFKRIAFMGLHGEREDKGHFAWSRARASGWKRALLEAHHHTDGLTVLPDFMPAATPVIAVQEAIGREQARRLIEPIRAGAISAVVTVNVHAAKGLMATLQESGLPPELWPVITTFGIGDANVSMMTSMLLPWEQLGRSAADLLWTRSRRTYDGAGRSVSVPMRLITRLTCRPAWRMRPEAALMMSRLESQTVAV